MHLSAPRSGPLDLDKGHLEMLQFTDPLLNPPPPHRDSVGLFQDHYTINKWTGSTWSSSHRPPRHLSFGSAQNS